MSAQIFHHPNHAAPPVKQLPRKGRLPASVGKVRKAWLKRYEASLRDSEIRKAKEDLQHMEELIPFIQSRIAIRRQKLAEMLRRHSQQNQA